MKFLFTLLFTNFIIMIVKSQNTYVNFQSFSDSKCKNSFGIGFSVVIEQCIYSIDGSDSYFYSTISDTNVIVQKYNSSNTNCFGDYVTYSGQEGSCELSPAIKFLNGTLVNDNVQYSQISVSKLPDFPIGSIVTINYSDDQCQDKDITFSTYISVGLVVDFENSVETYQCINNDQQPIIKQCIESTNCKNILLNTNCNNFKKSTCYSF